LGGTRLFLYDFILLRNRHLPFRDPTLIVMKEGPANNRLLFHFAASDCRAARRFSPPWSVEEQDACFSLAFRLLFACFVGDWRV
jgi:hypothetical protein